MRSSRVTSKSFLAERLNIEARISGIGNDEPVSLVFSSEDGQVADRHVLMKRGEDGRILHQRIE